MVSSRAPQTSSSNATPSAERVNALQLDNWYLRKYPTLHKDLEDREKEVLDLFKKMSTISKKQFNQRKLGTCAQHRDRYLGKLHGWKRKFEAKNKRREEHITDEGAAATLKWLQDEEKEARALLNTSWLADVGGDEMR